VRLRELRSTFGAVLSPLRYESAPSGRAEKRLRRGSFSASLRKRPYGSSGEAPSARLRELLFSLKILHQDVPDGDDVADGTGEDEEVENRVHEAASVERIEQGTSDVADAFGNNPRNGSRADTVE